MPTAVITPYLVIAPLPVVVEDAGEALSYTPGTVFQASSNNASIVRLLADEKIVEVVDTTPVQGISVIQGPPGPTGSSAATGWEDLGPLVRLIDPTDQVSAGYASPPAGAKVAIDAASGGFSDGLVVVNGTISGPHSGTASQRFGANSSALGACSVAVGDGATADFTNGSAFGKGAASTAAFGTALGTGATAGIDGLAAGSSASADQGGTALGRGASATGVGSASIGIGTTNIGQDSVLLGANGNISADEVIVVGAGGSGTFPGAVGVGHGVSVSAIDATAWGRGASAAFQNSHALGPGATTTAVNQMVVGSAANPIEFYYFGKGEAAVSAQDVRIASTRVATTQVNEPGSNLILEAGPGTGNAAPSRIFFQTAPAGPSGNSQQVLASQLIVGEGVDVNNWLNINSTLAVAPGDIAASDGTTTFFWDASTPQLNVGVQGATTLIKGIDATLAGTDGAGLNLAAGVGLTTGAGGTARLTAGQSGTGGPGGLAGVYGGAGVTAGGPIEVFGGVCTGATGGPVTLRGGAGTPAGAILVQGGITNGVGGQSASATISGGDASATSLALPGDGILKGGDGLSSNNHGGHALVQGGVADGAGVNGYVQIETAGVGRWRVDNSGHLIGVSDIAYDIGAPGSGRPRDLFVGRNATIDGNLTVNGTTTTVNTEVQTADNFILLNSEYTSDTPQTAGLVLNIDPAPTTFPIADITSDVVTVGAGDPSATLSPGDFVLIQNPANQDNAGLYEVLSTTASSITIDPTPAEAFSGTGLTDDATTQGLILGTSVTVLRSTATGDIESAFGSSSPLVFSVLAGDLATVLALGNTSGGTDIVLTSGDQITGGRANFGTTTDAAADGDLSVGLVGDSRLSYDQSMAMLSNVFVNGETSNIRYASTVVDFSVSGTASGLVPPGALPLGVTTYVLTPISGGGATGYNIGDSGDPDRWGGNLALAATTQSDPTVYTDNTLSFNASASAADVVLSGVGGTPTAGTVRVTLAYLSLTAPTS